MSEKDYKLINSIEVYQEARQHILDSDYLAFDTETTGVNVRKDKVIGFSFTGEMSKGYYMPLFYWDVKDEELKPYPVEDGVDEVHLLDLLAEKELLMWNASFDIRICKNDLGIDFTEALIADIMLMKHTVEEEGNFKLKEVAIEKQSYIGIDAERAANEEQIELKENIKKNGGSVTKTNFELYKGDTPIISKYACADVDLTLRLGEYYAKKLEKDGLEEFFYDKEVMPLYKYVTIPMEEHGIRLDMELIQQTRQDIIEDMEKLEVEVIEALFELPETEQWYNNMLAEKYPPKKGGLFGQKVAEKFFPDLPKTKTGSYSLGKKVVEKHCRPCKASGFLLGTAELDEVTIKEIQNEIHLEKEVKEVNISSKQQLGQIVFDYMGKKPLRKTPTGNPAFDDNMIQSLEKEGYEWARKLGNYNKLLKIKGAYIDRFLDAQEDGEFFPSFFQHRTISGRYGSDMQQLNRPKEEGELDPVVLKYNNVIRKFFIAGEGRKFIDNDYESLEPHVFAHVSGDEGLRDIFRKGHDFYSTIAIATEKLEGVSADKKADNYLGKVNKPLRQKAKAYSLGVPYGMKGYALGKSLGVDTEDAEELIEAYLSGFPNLRKWMQKSERKAKYEGYVESEAGRKRHLPEVKRLYKIHGDKLLDFKYRKKIEKKYGKDEVLNMYRDYKNGLNNAKNFQIQSLSASIVNMAAIEINKELKKRKIDGWVALQIHDQLVVNVPEEKAEECRDLIEDIMENNYKLSLSLRAPAEIGDNLHDAH